MENAVFLSEEMDSRDEMVLEGLSCSPALSGIGYEMRSTDDRQEILQRWVQHK